MPESELLKIVIQAGSFGLIAAYFIWHIGWGIPMLRQDRKETLESHVQISNGQSNALKELGDKHSAAMSAAADKHLAAMKELTRDFLAELKSQRELTAREFEKRDQAIQANTQAIQQLALRIEGCLAERR